MALKVGIVGVNGIGNRHADCHMEDDLAELVAICDIIPERADKTAEKHGIKAYYTQQEMMDAHPDLDVIDVCTGGNENGGWHFEPTMIALNAGKNVLVEKPISNDINEARQMVALAEEKDLYLGCNLNHFFTEPADEGMRRIKEGDIGEKLYCLHRMGPHGGEFNYNGPDKGPNGKGFPYFHVKAFLSHPFSIMRHFCGDITHVQAFMDKPGFRKAADDPMVSINSIHVKFASGAVGYLFSQRGDATMGLGGWWSVEIGGTRGTFVIENCVEKVTFYPAPGSGKGDDLGKMAVGQRKNEPVEINTGITDFGATFAPRLHAFLEDVANGVPKHMVRASGRDALATLEYTFAAIRSYESGGQLVQPDPLPILKRKAGCTIVR